MLLFSSQCGLNYQITTIKLILTIQKCLLPQFSMFLFDLIDLIINVGVDLRRIDGIGRRRIRIISIDMCGWDVYWKSTVLIRFHKCNAILAHAHAIEVQYLK